MLVGSGIKISSSGTSFVEKIDGQLCVDTVSVYGMYMYDRHESNPSTTDQ